MVIGKIARNVESEIIIDYFMIPCYKFYPTIIDFSNIFIGQC